jgi:hypothetical protein
MNGYLKAINKIKETVIELNNVKIEAFPSHHLDTMRGLPIWCQIKQEKSTNRLESYLLEVGYDIKNVKRMIRLLFFSTKNIGRVLI